MPPNMALFAGSLTTTTASSPGGSRLRFVEQQQQSGFPALSGGCGNSHRDSLLLLHQHAYSQHNRLLLKTKMMTTTSTNKQKEVTSRRVIFPGRRSYSLVHPAAEESTTTTLPEDTSTVNSPTMTCIDEEEDVDASVTTSNSNSANSLVGLSMQPTPPRSTTTKTSCRARSDSLVSEPMILPVKKSLDLPHQIQPLASILRSKTFSRTTRPSVSPSSRIHHATDPNKDTTSPLESFLPKRRPLPLQRSVSEPTGKKQITFDPRIWVREFERSPLEDIWYTEADMERFKRHALALILARQQTDAQRGISRDDDVGGRCRQQQRRRRRALYTHHALSCTTTHEDGDDDDALDNSDLLLEDPSVVMKFEVYRARLAQEEIRSVLLLDPHDICLTLFAKTFQTLLPDVRICQATTAEQAFQHLATQHFDIVLAEQRLQRPLALSSSSSSSSSSNTKTTRGGGVCCPSSGSSFFQTLAHISSDKCLWIGVSAHLNKDQEVLFQAGVDLCWSKPPPKVGTDLRNLLLEKLLQKRGKHDVAQDLFGTPLPSPPPPPSSSSSSSSSSFPTKTMATALS